MKKRLLALLLVLIMALQPAFSVTAWADEGEPEGEPAEAVEAVAEPEEVKEAEEVPEEPAEVPEEPAEVPEEPAEVAEEPAEVAAVEETPLEETAESPEFVKGWVKRWGEWYFYDNNGEPHNGWLQDKGKTYYCEDGHMVYGGVFNVEDTNGDYIDCAFNKDGTVFTGWWTYSWVDNGKTVKEYRYFKNGKAFSGWAKDSKYWYYVVNGWIQFDYGGSLDVENIDGAYYGFGPKGQMLTGWQKQVYTYNGTTYTQWYYFLSSGKGAEGWKQIGGKWYWFEYGRMAADGTYNCNGVTYSFDSNGGYKKVSGTGWTKLNGEWYYFNNDGSNYNGWVDGKYYIRNSKMIYSNWVQDNNTGEYWLFDAKGVSKGHPSGWFQVTRRGQSVWCYFENGQPYNGWKKDGSKWYYLQNGYALTDTWTSLEDPWGSEHELRFDSNGALVTGWKKQSYTYDGKTHSYWMHFDKNGKPTTGWVQDSKKNWYHFNNAYPDRGGIIWVDENNSYFFFNEDGTMGTGWKQWHGDWYYFEKSGKAAQGWKQLGGKWYYFYPHGEMAAGTRIYDDDTGKPYIIGENGVLAKGWVGIKVWSDSQQKEITQWWYANADGTGYTGWKKDSSGTWYYFDEGAPYSNGWEIIDDEWYFFDDYGKMVTGWYKAETYISDDGTACEYWVFLDKNGHDSFTGWKKSGGAWYYLDAGEAATYGVRTIDGVLYGFDGKSRMVTGWFKWRIVDDEHDSPYFIWYFFNSDGTGYTGWKKDSTHWYYFNNGTSYRDGFYKIGNLYYHFDLTGKCTTPEGSPYVG